MPLPVVAIIGRPNVGKSSIFNWLAGRRISIVDPTAGVTRDRVSVVLEEDGRFFDLMDTGGIGIVDSQDLSEDVERQIALAIDQADLILYVTDARSGPVALTRWSPTGCGRSASRSCASSTSATPKTWTWRPRTSTASGTTR